MNTAFMDELLNEETADRFVITDDGLADWAVRKIAEIDAETAGIEAHYARQLDIIRQRNNDRKTFFEDALREYFSAVPHRVTKTQQSYDLPSGKLVLKQKEPAYERDEERLVSWLKDARHTELVKTVEKADWSALKKRVAAQSDGSVVDVETGEIVPGVRAVAQEPEFKVVTGKEKIDHA